MNNFTLAGQLGITRQRSWECRCAVGTGVSKKWTLDSRPSRKKKRRKKKLVGEDISELLISKKMKRRGPSFAMGVVHGLLIHATSEKKNYKALLFVMGVVNGLLIHTRFKKKQKNTIQVLWKF